MLVVAAGLGAYIYFVEMQRDPAADSAAANREKVFTIETGSVEEVEITNDAAEVIRVTRQDMTWSLAEPEPAEADTVEVSTLVSSLESLERVKIIDDNPASAEPFGLAPPRIRVAFKTSAQAAPQALLIGNKTPTGGDLYAKVDGTPAVFLIAAYLEDTFNRKPFDLRDKTVLRFDREDVNTVSIAQGRARVALTKSGPNWRLSTPVDARADGAAADALISQLFQARMTSIAESDAGQAKLGDYGLAQPQVLVTVGAGSAKAELAIGKEEDETHYFARDLSRPLVFSIDKALLDELQKKADDFRVKDAFAYRSFSALGMDVAINGVTYTFAKVQAEGENSLEHWMRTAPATEQELDETKFEEFLTTMSNLRAESFATSAFNTGETVTVTARFGDAAMPETETVTLRKSGTVVHAIRSGEPGAAVVSTIDFDRAMGLLRELIGAQ